tara:strand:+ start:410 stop:796 length:387 start_codon:yes stop_codon:yes gene_type:complete
MSHTNFTIITFNLTGEKSPKLKGEIMNILEEALSKAIDATNNPRLPSKPFKDGIYFAVEVPTGEFNNLRIHTLEQAKDTIKAWFKADAKNRTQKMVDYCFIYERNMIERTSTPLPFEFKSKEFWKANK